ncbi:MAG: peptidylprolyl isomerase [Deltaproteobacteria bacterium]|nr:MAG: peptidylprolyl isomerase [Deltaproteobacteria bacterium]
MKIESKKHVTIHYTLTLESGEQLDSSRGGDPLSFVAGFGQIIPGLENALDGRSTGDKFTVKVSPEDGYGPASDEMCRDLPRENFPADMTLEPGQGFTAQGPHGPVSFTVVEVKDDVVVADFNHPLAGKELNFDVEVMEVRDLTEEEFDILTAQMTAASSCGSGCGSDCGTDSTCGPSGCNPGGGCTC